MEGAILNWVPESWNKHGMSSNSWSTQIELERDSEEFKQLQFEVRMALGNINKYVRVIERNQPLYDFGQFLIRGQLLLTLNRYTSYFHVALSYNVDHRRCGLSSVVFQKNIPDLSSEDILLVIRVITADPNSTSITPSNSSDYYIEYIVRF